MKYTRKQLGMIERHFNLFVRQDDDGNVVGNTDRNAETGWRPIYKDACQEAIKAQSCGGGQDRESYSDTQDRESYNACGDEDENV